VQQLSLAGNGSYAYAFNGATPPALAPNSTLTVNVGTAQQETLNLGGTSSGSIQPSFNNGVTTVQANIAISRKDEVQKLTIGGTLGSVVLTYTVGATTYSSSPITVDSVNLLPGVTEVTNAVNSLFAAMHTGLGANLTGGVNVALTGTGTYQITFTGTINPGTGFTKNFAPLGANFSGTAAGSVDTVTDGSLPTGGDVLISLNTIPALYGNVTVTAIDGVSTAPDGGPFLIKISNLGAIPGDTTVNADSTAFTLNADTTAGNDGMANVNTSLKVAVVGTNAAGPDANALKTHLQTITNQQGTGLAGNVEVVGKTGGPYTVFFKNNLTATDAPAITGSINGVSAPALSAVESNGGLILSPTINGVAGTTPTALQLQTYLNKIPGLVPDAQGNQVTVFGPNGGPFALVFSNKQAFKAASSLNLLASGTTNVSFTDGLAVNADAGNEYQLLNFDTANGANPISTFKLSVNGITTADITYSPDSQTLINAIQTELNKVLGVGNAIVNGNLVTIPTPQPNTNDPNTVFIEFTGALAHRNLNPVVVTVTSGTGAIRVATAATLAAATNPLLPGVPSLDGSTTEAISSLTLATGGFASGSAADVATGTNTLTVSGNITTVAQAFGAAGATVAGQLELTGGVTHTITANDSAAVSDLILNAGISNSASGSANIVKEGTGTLEYAGGDSARVTNVGNVAVNQGRLLLNKSTSTPAMSNPQILGTLTVGDGLGGQDADIVEYGSNVNATAQGTIATPTAAGNVAGTVVINNSGKLNLAGKNEQLNSLTMQLGAGSSAHLETDTATLTLNTATDPVFTLASNIGVSTQASPSIVLGGNASGGVQGTIAMPGARTITTVEGSQLVDVAIPATIVGGSTLTKTGQGTLALAGNATFSGAVTSNLGTLMIPGGGNLTAGGTGVNITGGTLAGGSGAVEGTITGNVTVGVGSAATLDPGSPGYPNALSSSTTGILTITGNLNFGANATFSANANTGTYTPTSAGTLYDQIKLTGAGSTVAIAPGAILTVPGTLNVGNSSGQQVTLIDTTNNTTPAISGTFQKVGGATINEGDSVAAGNTTMNAFYARNNDNNFVLIEPLTVVDLLDPVNTTNTHVIEIKKTSPTEVTVTFAQVIGGVAQVDGTKTQIFNPAGIVGMTIKGNNNLVAGNDIIIVNESGGILDFGITVDGGKDAGDQLIVTGGTYDSILDTVNSGTIQLTPTVGTVRSISYNDANNVSTVGAVKLIATTTALSPSPTAATTITTALTFTLPNPAPGATLGDDGSTNAVSRLTVTGFPTTDFTTKVGSNDTNVIVTHASNDTLTLNGTEITGNLTINSTNGASSAIVNLSGAQNVGPTKLNNLTINAANEIDLSGATVITGATGSQAYNGAVTLKTGTSTLSSNSTATGDGTGSVTFNGVVNGNFGLVVNTQGTTTFNQPVGASTPIASLTTNGSATASDVTVINANITTGAGGMNFGDVVKLGAASLTLAANGSGNITFNKAVDGASILNVNTTGTTTFSGAVGPNLISLTTDGSVNATDITVIGNNITTTGSQTYGDVVKLSAGTTLALASSGNNSITFQKAVDGAANLSVNTGGTTTFNGVVGPSVTSLSTDAAGTAGEQTQINANITTTGAQTFGDAVVLKAGSTLTVASTGAGAISFNKAVDGAANLTVNTANTTTFGAAVGGGAAGALTSLTTDGSATATDVTVLKGNVTTTGTQVYGDVVSLNAGSTLALASTGNSSITFQKAVDGAADLSVNTGGTTTFNGVVGPNVTSLTTDAAGTAGEQTQINANITTTGAQLYNDAVVLKAGATLTVASSGSGSITFQKAVDGAANLTVNTAGTTTFGAAVGGGTAGALTSLTTNGSAAASDVTVLKGNVTTTGAQVYGDVVSLNAGSNLVLGSTGNNSITFQKAVDGAANLSVNTGGTTTFNGAVGPSVVSLTTDAAGTAGEQTQINANITTSGTQVYGDAVVLQAGATLAVASTGNNSITFQKAVDGAANLSVNTGGTTTFNGAVGAGAAGALTSLTTDFAGTVGEQTQINANITTTGTQTYNDAVVLKSGATLALSSGSSGTITFNKAVDGSANLSLLTQGTATFNGAVGTGLAGPLTSLTTNVGGVTEIKGGAVTTTGTQSYGDAVSISGSNATSPPMRILTSRPSAARKA